MRTRGRGIQRRDNSRKFEYLFMKIKPAPFRSYLFPDFFETPPRSWVSISCIMFHPSISPNRNGILCHPPILSDETLSIATPKQTNQPDSKIQITKNGNWTVDTNETSIFSSDLRGVGDGEDDVSHGKLIGNCRLGCACVVVNSENPVICQCCPLLITTVDNTPIDVLSD